MGPWEARVLEHRIGAELDWEKPVAGPGVRGQSATVGGLFWTRIRLGKAVAGPGVRG